jgi:hypothetical protein
VAEPEALASSVVTICTRLTGCLVSRLTRVCTSMRMPTGKTNAETTTQRDTSGGGEDSCRHTRWKR